MQMPKFQIFAPQMPPLQSAAGAAAPPRPPPFPPPLLGDQPRAILGRGGNPCSAPKYFEPLLMSIPLHLQRRNWTWRGNTYEGGPCFREWATLLQLHKCIARFVSDSPASCYARPIRWEQCIDDSCLSVCLPVPCLTLNRERKGLGSWNLAGRKPMTRMTRDPI